MHGHHQHHHQHREKPLFDHRAIEDEFTIYGDPKAGRSFIKTPPPPPKPKNDEWLSGAEKFFTILIAIYVTGLAVSLLDWLHIL